MARTAVLGLPRVGPDRELKFALESFWAEKIGEQELLETASGLRAANWQRAQAAGVDVIPCGDFSLYDHVLDTAWALGAIPSRFGAVDRESLDDYFGLARGTASQRPLEMTKWFDTNYHYLVPELEPGQSFEPARRPLDRAAARERRRSGSRRGRWCSGRSASCCSSKGLERPLDLLGRLVPVYAELLAELERGGRDRGPDRRAVPGARPRAGRARRLRRGLARAGDGGRQHRALPRHLLRRPRPGGPRPDRRAWRRPSSTSTWSAPPSNWSRR